MAKGELIIIGGHEDKSGEQIILKEVTKRVKMGGGKLTLVTVATQEPEEMANKYVEVFKKLGVQHIETLDVRDRHEAADQANVNKVIGAAVVFFTGGDQLRITSQIGDSPVYREIRKIQDNGGTIAGTSAGAAAMSETMIVSGDGDESNRISSLGMAPGLGLTPGIVIDSHFAERGRIGRLLGAVAQNPKNLGVGIDENTAIIVKNELNCFEVFGEGGVYVLDGQNISYSGLSDQQAEGVLSIYDVNLHILASKDRFDLLKRRPISSTEDQS